MGSVNRWCMSLLAGIVLLAAACTGNSLDNSGGPNVILEVTATSTPGVTGAAQQGTCTLSGNACLSNFNCVVNNTCVANTCNNTGSACTVEADCDDTCVLPPITGICTVAPWSMTIQNVPLTPLAVSQPFNDVTLDTLTISYTWNTAVPFQTSNAVVTLGLTIQANEAATLQFFPVSQDVVDSLGDTLPSGSGASASLTLVFQGHVADGDPITLVAGGLLQVQACF